MRTIHVAHSPDSDDAFMFYALAADKLDTGDLRYVHELSDIETLNQRARRAELEVTAVSIHAYAYLWREYALLGSGSSWDSTCALGESDFIYRHDLYYYKVCHAAHAKLNGLPLPSI